MKIDWWLLTLTSPYSNFLTLDFGPFNTSHTTLTEIPNIVYLNTPFNLSCSAQAKPPASYRFYRGQESLGNISVGNTLEISVVERTNQVNYACIPFNQFGDGRAKIVPVEVYCKFSCYFFSSVWAFLLTWPVQWLWNFIGPCETVYIWKELNSIRFVWFLLLETPNISDTVTLPRAAKRKELPMKRRKTRTLWN